MKSPTKTALQRQRLITAILQHPTIEAAADAAGIPRTTAWRIRNSPEFEEEFDRARRQTFQQTRARAVYASNAALNVLLRIMGDTNAPTPSRVRAAVEVVNQARQATEQDALPGREVSQTSAVSVTHSKRVALSRLTGEQLALARELALAAQDNHGTP